MNDATQATISPESLQKGQSVSGETVWIHYTISRPERLQAWIDKYGSEESAKLAKLPQVLLVVKQWVESERRQMNLPPLVMHTAGGCLNILEDAPASAYLNGQAYQGMSRHRRATNRLINAVDPNALNSAERREHQNRINAHAFIASSAQGAMHQLRAMEKAGKQAPQIKGSREIIDR